MSYLRVYTDMGSPKESVLTLDELLKKAEETKAEAVAVTDYTMYAVQDLYDRISSMKKNGYAPKMITGATVNVVSDINDPESVPLKAVLYAKDNIGYHALCHIMTESQKHFIERDRRSIPVIDKNILASYIGEKTGGHEHVILLSGGADGIISGISLENNNKRDELEKLNFEIKSISEINSSMNFINDDIRSMEEKLPEIVALSKKNFDTEQHELESEKDPGIERVQDFFRRKKESEDAKIESGRLKARIKAKKAEYNNLGKRLMKIMNVSVIEDGIIEGKIAQLNKRKDDIKKTVFDNDAFDSIMKREALFYDSLAGHGCFYLELQFHGRPFEKMVMYKLCLLSEKLSIPLIATNDSFMAEKDDLLKKKFVNSMNGNIWEDPSKWEENMYLLPEDTLKSSIASCVSEKYADSAMNNRKTVIDQCNVDFKKDPHYPKYPCTEYTEKEEKEFSKIVSENNIIFDKKDFSKSDKLLTVKAWNGLFMHYDNVKQLHKDRLFHELNVIIKMEFSDYFLIVQDFLDVGRRCGHMPKKRLEYLSLHYNEMTMDEITSYINEDQSMPGLTIGPGRGSAAGSIVTYSIGITSIDPIKNGLLFERFLNPERVSMPDIDSDLSKSDFEYGVRDIVIGYVAKKYGIDGVCGIATPSTLAARAAVKASARIYGAKDHNNTTSYDRIVSRLFSVIPDDPKTKLRDYEEPARAAIEDDSEKAEGNKILDMAVSLEGVNVNFGRHACGNIIVDNRDVSEYAPLMMDQKSSQWKIEMNAEIAEERGYLKMDFLGLKNLNIITKAIRLIYKTHGDKVDPLKIPEEADVFREVFAKGRTNSVFQFESQGMKKMLKRFGPTSFSDLVLLVACYRPGPMQYLDGIIDRKHGKVSEENNAVLRIASYNKDFRDIVEPTYYAIVYQEQVMKISQILAGFTLGHADILRRAMGHKKLDVLMKEKDAFVDGSVKNGVKKEDAEALFTELEDFASYSFNKSHAAAYAMIAYVTGWLKFHYPVEFYTAAANFSDFKKYQSLLHEASEFGVGISAPDINVSMSGFTCSGNTIYFGFNGIKGLKKITGDIIKKKRWSGLSDFILNSGVSQSETEKLILSGAFDSFIVDHNRDALIKYAKPLYEIADVVKKKRQKISVFDSMLDDIHNGIELSREKYKIKTKSIPTEDSILQKKEASERNVEDLIETAGSVQMPSDIVNNRQRALEDEKALLGLYISGNPIDSYIKPKGAVEIADVSENDHVTILSMIETLRQTKSKKSGADIAFMTVADRSGSIECCVFQDAYEKYGQYLENGLVIIVSGRVQKKKGEEHDDEGNDILQIVVDSIQPGQIRMPEYSLFLPDGFMNWESDYKLLKHYENSTGKRITVFDNISGKTFVTDFLVDDAVLRCEELKDRLIVR